jgi:hypothetical protein
VHWNLVVAAVGGGVVVAVAAPLVRIPRELDAHDTQMQHMDDDGVSWIEDRGLEVARELERVMLQNNMPSAPSGAHVNWRQIVIEDAGHQLRDRVRVSEQARDLMRTQERWWHRAWSLLFRRKRRRLDLQFPVRGAEVLAGWREAQVQWAASIGVPVRAWRPNDLIDP